MGIFFFYLPFLLYSPFFRGNFGNLGTSIFYKGFLFPKTSSHFFVPIFWEQVKKRGAFTPPHFLVLDGHAIYDFCTKFLCCLAVHEYALLNYRACICFFFCNCLFKLAGFFVIYPNNVAPNFANSREAFFGFYSPLLFLAFKNAFF